MALKKGHLVALLLLEITVMAVRPPSVHAVQFSRERDVTWDSIVRETRSFFANVFLGGVDEDGDGTLSNGERANSSLLRSASVAAVLVGVTCGLLGCFITLRRMAMFGDMLGHAVLPGIAVGYILVGSKSTPALLLGALGAGLLAAALTKTICSWSRVKEDAALGISLSFFYALGSWLLFWITRDPALRTEASGLDEYLFGNPAVINPPDLWALGLAAAVVLGIVSIGFKEFLVCTFDQGFAASIGLNRGKADTTLLVLLTVVIVVSIKVLGVVLVAAALTIPPATAYLLTDRLKRLCLVSAAIGALSGFGGTYLSAVLYIGTGPAIVCLAFGLLLVVFVVSPRHGILSRILRHRSLALRTARENILAAAFRICEREKRSEATSVGVTLENIAAARNESVEATRAIARKLRGSGWALLRDDRLVLTVEGEERARRVVRTHRLWELFLSQEARLPPDHVHPGAEEIEHYMTDEALEELEKFLNHPRTDPHGRAIPDSKPRTGREQREADA